ncbi:MAG: CDP-glucose 4,6-dehydratase [Proteobacteria bacterium]|nr:CDP-glucose 4,6-dehydratase [Pseudomonadota bacterium]
MADLALGAAGAPDPRFWRNRRVLLTGHTGFKGSWLLLLLKGLGARVSGFSLAPDTTPAMFDQIGGSGLCGHHIGDIRDAALVAQLIRKVDPEVVLHLAAQPLVRRSYVDPLETFSINVMGTANVLQAAREAPSLRAIVSVTTDKCYENDGRRARFHEDDRLGGHDPYSNSKACAELVSQCFRDCFFADRGVGLATARAGNVIGGGDYSSDRLVVDAVAALAVGRDPEIRNPDATRPWQHVLDPLTGYLLLAERLHQDPAGYAGSWNFGPKGDAPVRRVVELLASAWGREGVFERQGGMHPHEAATLALDSTKAQQALGWQPRFTLEQAVAATAEWYRSVNAGADPAALSREQIARYGAQLPAAEDRAAA